MESTCHLLVPLPMVKTYYVFITSDALKTMARLLDWKTNDASIILMETEALLGII